MDKGLTERIIAGDVRAAARLMRGIDDDLPEATQELEKLYQYTGKAFIIGITGSPGVGKSTLVDSLVTNFRKRQMTVGVVGYRPYQSLYRRGFAWRPHQDGQTQHRRRCFIRSLAAGVGQADFPGQLVALST